LSIWLPESGSLRTKTIEILRPFMLKNTAEKLALAG